MARKKSSGTSGIRLLIGAIVAIVILYLALSGGGISQDTADQLKELGIEVPDSIIIKDDGDSNTEVVIEDNTFSGGWYDLHFTEPINESNWDLHKGAPIEAAVIAAIDGAQQSIDGAFFEFNMQSLTDAFLRAKARGVTIRLVVDDDHALLDDESTIGQLEAAGIPIVDDNRGALMHNKYMVIDKARVWTGSMNFTHNGLYNNNNNAMLIRSTRLAEDYTTDFEEMFVDKGFTRTASGRVTPYPQITINGTLVEVFFSPDEGDAIVSRVQELINGSQQSVYIMTLSLTLSEFSQAAIAGHNRGVLVQAIFESRQSTQQAEQMDELGCAGIGVKQDGNPNTFHHKVVVIDGQIVVLGSFNFSNSARNDNSENVLIIHNADIAQQFINEFNRRYNDTNAKAPSRSELGC